MATTTTSPNNSARTVTGLMAFAVLFSLVGNEIKVANGASNDKLGNGLTKGGQIIIGGFIAAALLSALTGAGEGGRKFGVGLATVTAVTATLVYGKPVWDAISAIVSGTPSKPTGSVSGTSPTAATAGTAPTTEPRSALSLINLAG